MQTSERTSSARSIRPDRGSGFSNGGFRGGGDDWNDSGDPDSDSLNPDKAKIVTWFLLLVVTMTFGGLIAAYVVIATNGVAEWKPFSLPIQVWISTLLIFASSVTYHLGKTAVDQNEPTAARKWLLATTVIGASFISSQMLLWMSLVKRGFYLSGNPYAGFFYILTAIHAVHVLGGVIALGCVIVRSWYDTSESTELEYRRHLARSVGWYWHFMGILWLLLVVLLGFWK